MTSSQQSDGDLLTPPGKPRLVDYVRPFGWHLVRNAALAGLSAVPGVRAHVLGTTPIKEHPMFDLVMRQAPPAPVIHCNCAHVSPTMPTCRGEHLPTCPVASGGGER